VKVVLDSNVLVSAVLTPDGLSGVLLRAWRDGAFHLCASEALIEEASGVATRPRLARYGLSPDEVASIFAEVRDFATLPYRHIEPVTVVRDPKDNMILECAVGCAADLIVTNDDDLLALKDYEGVGIMNIRDFLRTLGLT
jgi:putative PIN family toxin of toxin-antitoxin system